MKLPKDEVTIIRSEEATTDGVLVVFITKYREYSDSPPNWWVKEHPGDAYYYDSESVQGILPVDNNQQRIRWRNYGAETWALSNEELQALTSGKTLAREINGGEYGCFLKVLGEK